MALSASKLEGCLGRDFFGHGSSVFVEPAQRFASCYARYATDARSCQGLGPVPGTVAAAELKLAGCLATALHQSRTQLQFANLYATGLAAFWLAPPLAFLGGTPGVVITANPAVLQAALLTMLGQAVLEGTAHQLTPAKDAKMWSRVLHSWTTSAIVVVHGPPSGCSANLT